MGGALSIFYRALLSRALFNGQTVSPMWRQVKLGITTKVTSSSLSQFSVRMWNMDVACSWRYEIGGIPYDMPTSNSRISLTIEKKFIIINRKSVTFLMSWRSDAYVSPMSPKGASSTRIYHFVNTTGFCMKTVYEASLCEYFKQQLF